jgi:hypothetical protein
MDLLLMQIHKNYSKQLLQNLMSLLQINQDH